MYIRYFLKHSPFHRESCLLHTEIKIYCKNYFVKLLLRVILENYVQQWFLIVFKKVFGIVGNSRVLRYSTKSSYMFLSLFFLLMYRAYR